MFHDFLWDLLWPSTHFVHCLPFDLVFEIYGTLCFLVSGKNADCPPYKESYACKKDVWINRINHCFKRAQYTITQIFKNCILMFDSLLKSVCLCLSLSLSLSFSLFLFLNKSPAIFTTYILQFYNVAVYLLYVSKSLVACVSLLGKPENVI